MGQGREIDRVRETEREVKESERGKRKSGGIANISLSLYSHLSCIENEFIDEIDLRPRNTTINHE